MSEEKESREDSKDVGSIPRSSVLGCRSQYLIVQVPHLGFRLSDYAVIIFSFTTAFPSTNVSYGVRPLQRLPWCSRSRL